MGGITYDLTMPKSLAARCCPNVYPPLNLRPIVEPMPAKRYSWIVGENDNYDCYVIIGDNRLTDRMFLIKLERLYFPVSDTPARNTCGSRFVGWIIGANFLTLSLSFSLLLENLQFFNARRNILSKKYSLVFFFFFDMRDSFWFSNLRRGLDYLRFVCKKKERKKIMDIEKG